MTPNHPNSFKPCPDGKHCWHFSPPDMPTMKELETERRKEGKRSSGKVSDDICCHCGGRRLTYYAPKPVPSGHGPYFPEPERQEVTEIIPGRPVSRGR